MGQEERKVRERQVRAQQEAQRKRAALLEQERLEMEALKRAHTEGMLCVLKDAKAQLSDVTLRVPLVDSVGFPTTISHLKSRLRAEYVGAPPEHRQVQSRKLIAPERSKIPPLPECKIYSCNNSFSGVAAFPALRAAEFLLALQSRYIHECVMSLPATHMRAHTRTCLMRCADDTAACTRLIFHASMRLVAPATPTSASALKLPPASLSLSAQLPRQTPS